MNDSLNEDSGVKKIVQKMERLGMSHIGSERFSKSGKDGMALLIVLGFLAAFFVTVFYLHSYSTNQRFQSHMISSREVASRVAEFGAKQVQSMVRNAIAFLNSSDPDTFPKCEKGLKDAHSGMDVFFKIFVDENGRLSEKEQSTEIPVPLAKDTVLSGLTFTPSLSVVLTLEGQKPAHASEAIPGVTDSSADVVGRFIIDSTATYDNVTRRVVCIFEQRTVQMTIPVLSRFTLTVLDIPDKDNKLCGNLYTTSGTIPEAYVGASHTPLVILGGQTPSESKTEDVAAAFLDKQGWVFILPEITLGMGPGSGKYGEQFLLASGSTFYREIQNGTGPFGTSFGIVRGKNFEMWNTHQIYSRLTGLYQETKEEDRYYFLSNVPGSENVQYSSLLRLMGTSERPSPTLVFGNVLRSYVLEQGLQKKTAVSPTDCALLPYVQKDKFGAASWTWGLEADSQKVLKETCNNSWDVYCQAMSVPVSNVPFNEGLAFWFDPAGYTGKATPRAIQPSFKTAAIPKLNKALEYVPKQPDKLLLDQNTALYRGGAKVFAGELAKVLPHIGNYCVARCGRQFKSGEMLKKYLTELHEKEMNPTGFYLVKEPFEWTDEWNALAVGGVGIVCNKGITITDAVKPAPSKALKKDCTYNPIYLVCLQGDITLNTGNRVEAALIAVRGGIHTSAAGIDVYGFVAAKTLENSGLCNTSPMVIQYDPRYDWADTQSYEKGFRTMLEQQPVVFFAKPN